jgi:hypothetical protein
VGVDLGIREVRLVDVAKRIWVDVRLRVVKPGIGIVRAPGGVKIEL